MVDCGKVKKAGNTPIVFEAAFGNLGFDLKTTIVSGFILG
jgi:ABC-type multidrug transport system permease subunit